MINGFEYRDNLPKCPERSDRWLSPSNDECERDDECEEYGEDGDGDEEPSDYDSYQEPSDHSEDGDDDSHQEPSDDELAYQEFLDAFGKK